MTDTSEYWVGETIGEGSNGKVVHARHKSTKKNVAIKVFLKRQIMEHEPSLLQDIYMERNLLIKLKSDFVVPLWAAFHDSECLYFVMECFIGGDLDHVIRCGLQQLQQLQQQQDEGRFHDNGITESSTEITTCKWYEAIPYYALQLLSALEYIHSQKVVHADLKPQNVLVSSDGNIKLADFGSAIQLQELLEDDTASIVLHNIGTVDYASPEVIRASTISSSSSSSAHDAYGIDLWSFGCVLYAMWEGHSPFHDKCDALAVQRIVEHRQEQKQLGTMPLRWRELIHELLAPEASRRLGMADWLGEGTTMHNAIEYTSIRSRSCLADTGNGNGNTGVVFLGTTPSWWANAENGTLRDGAEGWSAFLLS